MNVEIGTEAAQFLFWEYINRIIVAVQVCVPLSLSTHSFTSRFRLSAHSPTPRNEKNVLSRRYSKLKILYILKEYADGELCSLSKWKYNRYYFLYIVLAGKSVCRTLLFLCHAFMIFESCLGTNSEYFQLSHPSLCLSHPSPFLASHPLFLTIHPPT